MSETTKTKKSNHLDGRSGNTRSKSFRLDEDTVLGVWADHNSQHKNCHSYDEEARYQAYRGFCYKLFCALTDTKIAKQYRNGSAPNRILDFPKLACVLDPETTEHEKEQTIYNFMAERTARKAEDMLDELRKYNVAIQLPFGHEWRNWMNSPERLWQNRAALFDNAQ
jgi:hypothetical protein